MTLDSELSATVEPEAVEFVYTVTNGGEGPVTLQFSSGQVADVAVSDGERAVWRWSEGRMFTQALDSRTLGPGESITRELTWTDPEPGSYTATATLTATNADVSASASVEV